MTKLNIRTAVVSVVTVAAWCPASAFAQASNATPAPPAVTRGAAAVPMAQPAYSYQPEGRRDPFISLVGRGSDPASAGARPSGLPGLLIDELSIKGIISDRSGFVAMIQGPDNKTYLVRPGEKLMDGSVKSITGDSVVFAQDVSDPLSTVRQRERVKKLRSSEEGRQ
ncbi:MAG: pilus assembly protein PilP [Vicinamibacterales bacterium]